MTESTLANAALWTYGIAAACFAAFALRLVLGWRSSQRAVLLLSAVLATAFWTLGGVAVALRPGYPTWLLAAVGDALRYALWFLFLGQLLKPDLPSGTGRLGTPVLPRWVVAAVGVALLASVVLEDGRPFDVAIGASWRTTVQGIHLGLAILGLMLIEQVYRRAHPKSRWGIRPLCVGLAGVFAFDLYFFSDAMLFAQLDPSIWVVRGIANALVIPFIAVATARNTGWTIEMHMSRSAVFHTTAVLVSGLFLLVVAVAGYLVRYFGGEWGAAVQIALLFAAALVTMFVVSSGSFRSRLRVFVSKHFFSYRYDYREEWLRFTRTLGEAESLPGLRENCTKALADLVESPGGTLWLREEGDAYRVAARVSMPAVEGDEPATGPLAAFLQRTGWVVDLTDYARFPERYPELSLPQWLQVLPGAWLVVPLVSGASLVGFVVLATPRARVEVDWEVRDLLKTASRQAASFLEQFRATEALLETRKFDAFNRMSAFVVHDLKNLVAQLSLMMNNAERHRDNPEFQRDMLTTVDHVVGRMNHLMLQLRTGTTPVDKAQPVDLERILRQVCAAKGDPRRPIALDLGTGVTTFGHEDRLEHVFGHLVQNALDATADEGSVSVRLAREDGSAVVEVADTGVGMTAEFVRDRLFRPFETSKPAGMGIGVYESAQYVAALGGQIVVDSTPGAGTRMRVVLPIGGGTDRPGREPKVAV